MPRSISSAVAAGAFHSAREWAGAVGAGQGSGHSFRCLHGQLELLQKVYRGELKATPQQMRAAIECLSYENPKLSAVQVGYINAEDFASRLERALNRSDRAKLIEARAAPTD